MSILRSIFKIVKTTAQVTNAGLEQLDKGMSSLNKSLEDLKKMQDILREAKLAFSIQLDLIDLMERGAKAKIELSKINTEEIERKINEHYELIFGKGKSENYSSRQNTRASLLLSSKKDTVWPLMRKPVVDDPLFQVKANAEFDEMSRILERYYGKMRSKCRSDKKFHKFFKNELIASNCPEHLINKMTL